DAHMKLICERDVRRKATLPGDERPVLEPRHRSADIFLLERTHMHLWGAIAPPHCAKVRYWRTNGLRLIRRTRAHFGGGGAHRLDDILIPGTAAQIGREHVDQVHIADVGLAFEHADDQHEETRRAEAALQPVMVHEGALERMQLV